MKIVVTFLIAALLGAAAMFIYLYQYPVDRTGDTQALPAVTTLFMAYLSIAPYSWRITSIPAGTDLTSFAASQFVSRMQPCDCALPTPAGSGVPWIP